MYSLVADIEKYPEFLPWCIDCQIVKQDGDTVLANLVVGYKLFREWFVSRVTLNEPTSIRVEYANGPLRHLSNNWEFIPTEDGGCMVDFYVDFEFKNPLFQKLMGMFFNEIVTRMVGAFIARAEKLYGKKASRKAPPSAQSTKTRKVSS